MASPLKEKGAKECHNFLVIDFLGTSSLTLYQPLPSVSMRNLQ